MKNLEELERKYKELGKEIERLKEEQNIGRLKKGKQYYTCYGDGSVESVMDNYSNSDDRRYTLGNYFKTKEEAREVVEKIKIYTELKRLAERLNNGEKIDWKNISQMKYSIEYQHERKELCIFGNTVYQKQGSVYCLEGRFKDIAIKEIGKDRLKKLFE